MLTANHCGWGWDYETMGGREVGTISHPSSCTLDAATLIGMDYSPRAYIGDWESGASMPVSAWTYPAVGQSIYLSGGFSGEHVVTVEATGIRPPGGPCWQGWRGPGFWTVDPEGDGSSGDGDSGGPVYTYHDDESAVTGLGITMAGDAQTRTDCEGIRANWRRCASRAFHTNLGEILDDLDLTLQ